MKPCLIEVTDTKGVKMTINANNIDAINIDSRGGALIIFSSWNIATRETREEVVMMINNN